MFEFMVLASVLSQLKQGEKVTERMPAGYGLKAGDLVYYYFGGVSVPVKVISFDPDSSDWADCVVQAAA